MLDTFLSSIHLSMGLVTIPKTACCLSLRSWQSNEADQHVNIKPNAIKGFLGDDGKIKLILEFPSSVTNAVGGHGKNQNFVSSYQRKGILSCAIIMSLATLPRKQSQSKAVYVEKDLLGAGRELVLGWKS